MIDDEAPDWVKEKANEIGGGKYTYIKSSSEEAAHLIAALDEATGRMERFYSLLSIVRTGERLGCPILHQADRLETSRKACRQAFDQLDAWYASRRTIA